MEEENKEIEKNETIVQEEVKTEPVVTPVNTQKEVKPKEKVLLFVIISLIVLVGVGVLLLVLLTGGDKKEDKPKDNNQIEEIKEEKEQEENKEEENKQENNNTEDSESYYSELEKKIKAKVATYHTNETATQKSLINFIDKYLLGGLYYSYNDNENPSEPSSELERLAYNYVVWSREEAAGNNITEDIYTVSKEDMDIYFKEVFNVTPTKYQNIICDMDKNVLYFYKDGKFVYNENHGGHGNDNTSRFIDYYIVDYKEDGNMITTKLILMDYDEQNGYKINSEEDEKIFDELSEEYYQKDYYQLDFIDLFHKNIERYKKNSMFEYTFEKKDNTFILKLFKIVK